MIVNDRLRVLPVPTHAHEHLSELQGCYQVTGNSLYCWAAIAVHQIDDVPLPPWVSTYFTLVLHDLQLHLFASAFGLLSSNPAQAVAHGFRFIGLDMTADGKVKADKGPSNDIRTYEQAERDLELALRVRLHIVGGQVQTNAVYLVSNATGHSEPTVLRAWQRFKSVAEAGCLEDQRRRLQEYDFEATSSEDAIRVREHRLERQLESFRMRLKPNGSE